LAVLPLESLSSDASQDYFADGMTDELISDLGQISALRVISRTSVMAYKRTRKPLPQIARELNVDAVEELQSLAMQNSNFALVPTVTGHKTLAWPYEKGHINREMLTRHLLGLNGPIYYIAGPSGMVTAMSELLKSSGVNEDDMRTEEFGDYRLSQDPAQGDQTTGNNRSDSAL
jgi:ferredoxin-NADP reductase